MIASDVEQKFLVPEFVLTGVATTTYSVHGTCLQVVRTVKRYPDLLHHAPTVQLTCPRVESIKWACCGEKSSGALGLGPRLARS